MNADYNADERGLLKFVLVRFKFALVRVFHADKRHHRFMRILERIHATTDICGFLNGSIRILKRIHSDNFLDIRYHSFLILINLLLSAFNPFIIRIYPLLSVLNPNLSVLRGLTRIKISHGFVLN
jgi:hypothetical protein